MNDASVITTKKAFPWWIIAASVEAVILIAALAWFLWPNGIDVPVVVGLDIGEATKKIEDLKLKVKVMWQPNTPVAAGCVFAQEPAGKSKAEEGDTVKLLVAEAWMEGPIVAFEDDFDNRVKPGWSQTKTELKINDCVYKSKRAFTHNKGDLDMVFIGDLREGLPENRNTRNESWGLDNVRIEVQ